MNRNQIAAYDDMRASGKAATQRDQINDRGEHIGWIVFAHRIHARWKAVFEAVEVLTARCPKPSQPDAFSGVLGLLMAGRAA